MLVIKMIKLISICYWGAGLTVYTRSLQLNLFITILLSSTFISYLQVLPHCNAVIGYHGNSSAIVSGYHGSISLIINDYHIDYVLL